MVDLAYEPIRNESISVTTSNTIVSKMRGQGGDQRRKLIIVRNNSPNSADIITINFGVSATANTGIILKQYESYVDSDDAGYSSYQGQINAICATANGVLAILER